MQCYNIKCMLRNSDGTCSESKLKCHSREEVPNNEEFNEVFHLNLNKNQLIAVYDCENEISNTIKNRNQSFWELNKSIVLLKSVIESILKLKPKDFYSYIDKRFKLCRTTTKNHLKLYEMCIKEGRIINYERFTYSQLVEMSKFKNKFNLNDIDETWSVLKIKEFRNNKEKPVQSKVEDDSNKVEENYKGQVSFMAIRSVSKKLLERFKYNKQDVSTIIFDLFQELNISTDGIMSSIIQADEYKPYEIKYNVGDIVYWKDARGKYIKSVVLSIHIFENEISYSIRIGKHGVEGYKSEDLYSEVPMTVSDLKEVKVEEAIFEEQSNYS